jgi:LAO/AO transport system kinase
VSANSGAKRHPHDNLADGVRAGNRAAIARAISTVESGGEKGALLLRALRDLCGRARVFGLTGAPGVGKSTLVGGLIAELRKRGRSVAVIAVDPSSPISGGAILGDRVRMTANTDDDGVFIRSLASRGSTGGLSLAASRAVDVLDAAGFDTVLIETVGAGQSEIDVADVADLTVVTCAPGLGDDVQAMKAGLLEVADVLVVNKADDPLASVTARQLRSMLSLRQDARRDVPVLESIATQGKGIGEITDTLDRLLENFDARTRAERRHARLKRLLATAAGDLLARKVRGAEATILERLCGDVASGGMNLEDAAREILKSDVWHGE